jgi:hypothetical protein
MGDHRSCGDRVTTQVEPVSDRRSSRVPALTARITVRGRAIPTWAILLIGYALSRLLTTGLLAGAYLLASTQGWTIAHYDGSPGLLGFLKSWDGLYYGQVAVHGYPTQLPTDSTGDVAKNAWAFLPLYPVIVHGLMAITGLDFTISGMVVSVLFGGAATFALHRVLLQRFGSTTALWGALFFCFGPLSYVLQVTYAESVFLFFMFCALAAMIAKRYLLMIPFGIAAAFAHPGALALAAALGIQALVRLIRREGLPRREWVTGSVALVTIAVAGLAWPLVASAVTGNPDAYFDSELAWWRDYIGQLHFVPFTPWFVFAGHYWGVIGVVLVLAVIGGLLWWLTRRSMRVLGLDLLAYIGSYLAYLIAVFLPQQSLFRMLLPLSPLLGHPVLSRTRKSSVITLCVCVALQPVGILLFWVIWPP